VLGARLAPAFLSGGSGSEYAPLVALGGALAGALLLRAAAQVAGSLVRGGLHLLPPLRALDSLAGGIMGAAFGFVLVWIAAVAAVQLPRDAPVREEVRSSQLIRTLNEIAPPRRVLDFDVSSRRLPLGE
jgi:hypothetical protein